ncbi:MAG: hypothetical protein IKW59_02950 [Clostridia bacterium]|nr:hypothetical protein [Clostridia bacterium]
MKNKVLSLVLILLIAFSMCLPAYADNATATIKAVVSDCTVNRQITVSIQISGAQDVCGASLEVMYDNSALELVSATKGSIIPADSSQLNDKYTDYSVKLNWMSGQEAIADGEILSLVFNTKLTGKALISFDKIKLSKFDETPVSCIADDVLFDIYPECESITISGPDKITDKTAYSAICEPTGFPSKFVKWSIDNEEIAYINESGILTPYVDGEITITAEATDGTGIKATKTVYADVVLCEAFEIDDESSEEAAVVWCPENGITTVDITFAAYDELGKMIAFKPYTADLKEGKNTVPATDFNFSGARKIKIFMWDSVSNALPLCVEKEFLMTNYPTSNMAVVTGASNNGENTETVKVSFFETGEAVQAETDVFKYNEIEEITKANVFEIYDTSRFNKDIAKALSSLTK